MVFSNNMEYDDGSPEPLEGAFYASSSYDEPTFNCFREEEPRDLTLLLAPIPRPIDSSLPCFPATASLSCSNSQSPMCGPKKAWRSTSCVTRRSSPPRRLPGPSKPASARASSGIPRGAAKPPWPTTTSFTSRPGSRKKGGIPKFYFIVDRIDLLTSPAVTDAPLHFFGQATADSLRVCGFFPSL